MPNLFTVSGYKIYFWSNENSEPLHVHVSKGQPGPHSTKIWIPKSELSKLMEFISAQYFIICDAWKKFFVIDEINFYC